MICLDVLRTLEKEPNAIAALFAELHTVAHDEPRLSAWLQVLQSELAATEHLEGRARYIVEGLALATQGALMKKHAPLVAADAFCGTRLAYQGGRAWGTLPTDVDCAAIIARAWPD